MREKPAAQVVDDDDLEMEIEVSDEEAAPAPKRSSTNAHIAPRRTK